MVDVPFTVAKNVRVPVKDYRYTLVQGSYRFGSQRKVSGAATARWGTPAAVKR